MLLDGRSIRSCITFGVQADGAEIRTKMTPDLNTLISQLGDLGHKLEDALGGFSSSMNGDGRVRPML